MNVKLLVSLVNVVIVAALCPVGADAYPMFWTDSTKSTPLRDLKTLPKLSPDVLEFANEGPVTFSTKLSTGTVTVSCEEVELGTTIDTNNGLEETLLSITSGVVEGDRCATSAGSAVPFRFHAVPPWLGVGAVGSTYKVAKITVTGTGAPYVATLHYLPMAQDFGGKVCRWNFELVQGVVENATEGFVEDGPPNLSLSFSATGVPIKNTVNSHGCPTTGEFHAQFYLDTASTATDTAFVG